ncbi:MAG: P1 family peptidase [Bacillota bacterium]
MYNRCITDVPGIKVGQETDSEGLTGCTVILCEKGAVCGVDIRGSAPGTRETDLLQPHMLVDSVHGVVLAGGSAFGLAAADGVMSYLEEHQVGFDVGITRVPIVTGAVLFDLYVGNHKVRPDKEMGYCACQKACKDKIQEGNYGAGTGATVGKVLGQSRAMKGGIGSHSIILPNGVIIGAVVAVNAFGDIRDVHTGSMIAGARNQNTKALIETCKYMQEHTKESLHFSRENTTIGVIATNAKLTKAQCQKLAQMGMRGYGKVISPYGTTLDGDMLFALSTGEEMCDLNVLGIAAAEAVAVAINNGIQTAASIEGIPSSYEYFHQME